MEFSMHIVRLLVLIIFTFNFQVIAYDSWDHATVPNSTRNIVFVQVDGEVSVYMKEDVSQDTDVKKPLVVSNALRLTFLPITLSAYSVSSYLSLARIKNIHPEDTDSIIINGRTGYPDPSDKYWLFNLYDTGISLYSVHPTKYKILHRFKYDSNVPLKEYSHLFYSFDGTHYTKLPRTLTVSSDSKLRKLLAKTKQCSLGDSLTYSPRLFAEYDSDPVAVLELFGEISQSSTMSLERRVKIAELSRDIMQTSLIKFTRRKIAKLMELDSTNVIGNIKLADQFRKNEEYKRALNHIEIAKHYSQFDDYLITFSEAKLYEQMKEYARALELYENALTETSLFSKGTAIIVKEKIDDRIKKLSRRMK